MWALAPQWTHFSVLCEDEHPMQPEKGVEYTACFDAWKREIRKVNPSIILVGPEYYPDHVKYYKHFLNASNYHDGKSPAVVSSHLGLSYEQSNSLALFDSFDSWRVDLAVPMEAVRAEMAPDTQSVMNEFVPFVNEYCDTASQYPGYRCPNPEYQNASNVKMNRQTLGWSAAAAVFAYGFGSLSEMGYIFS